MLTVFSSCSILYSPGKKTRSLWLVGASSTDLLYVEWSTFLPCQQLPLDVHCKPGLELPLPAVSVHSSYSFYCLGTFSLVPVELLILCLYVKGKHVHVQAINRVTSKPEKLIVLFQIRKDQVGWKKDKLCYVSGDVNQANRFDIQWKEQLSLVNLSYFLCWLDFAGFLCYSLHL